MNETSANFLAHWKQYEPTFEMWIEKEEPLQEGMDILEPLIKEFRVSNPNTNLGACRDCLVSMLIWCKRHVKELEVETKPTKK